MLLLEALSYFPGGWAGLLLLPRLREPNTKPGNQKPGREVRRGAPGARGREVAGGGGAWRKGSRERDRAREAGAGQGGRCSDFSPLPPSQPPPSLQGKVTDFTWLLSCCGASSSQPPPHSPTSPLKRCLGQGRARGFRSLPAPARRASTDARRRSRLRGSLGAGVQGGSPGSGTGGKSGGGGGPGLKAPSRGAAAVRAGGSQLRGEDTGAVAAARSRLG